MATAAQKQTFALNEGDIAPDFTLPGDDESTVTLSGFKGKKKVVLYFYPKDDTPGCTIEAKDFRDAMADFEGANTVVIGISKDTISKHVRFKDKYCLPFTLVSDAESNVCERYGQWVEKSMYGKKYMGINRATFLIGTDGKIARLWPKVKIEGHAQEVLKAAHSL